jgi:hypothetical protein
MSVQTVYALRRDTEDMLDQAGEYIAAAGTDEN